MHIPYTTLYEPINRYPYHIGVTINFAKRFEPSLPRCSDRTVTISGTVYNCIQVSNMIIEKVNAYYMKKSASGQNYDHSLSNQSYDQNRHQHSGSNNNNNSIRHSNVYTTYSSSGDRDDYKGHNSDHLTPRSNDREKRYDIGGEVNKYIKNSNISNLKAQLNSVAPTVSAAVVSASTTVSLSISDHLVGKIRSMRVTINRIYCILLCMYKLAWHITYTP